MCLSGAIPGRVSFLISRRAFEKSYQGPAFAYYAQLLLTFHYITSFQPLLCRTQPLRSALVAPSISPLSVAPGYLSTAISHKSLLTRALPTYRSIRSRERPLRCAPKTRLKPTLSHLSSYVKELKS
jgi:hypothetical protein